MGAVRCQSCANARKAMITRAVTPVEMIVLAVRLGETPTVKQWNEAYHGGQVTRSFSAVNDAFGGRGGWARAVAYAGLVPRRKGEGRWTKGRVKKGPARDMVTGGDANIHPQVFSR